jgi:D-methionine transport system permease protein
MAETNTVSNLVALAPDIARACGETGLMVGIGLAAAVVLGGPLGVWLFLTRPGQLFAQPWLNAVLDWLVNLVRSFPFIILMVALVPLTRALVGTSIGPLAAAVPLAIAAVPYFARLVEQTLREVPRGVIEAAQAMGASPMQIVGKVLLTEARAGLVSSFSVVAVSFLSYSAVAGVVGGGGIGDLAIRYGYHRFQTDVMIAMVLLLIVVVQVIQTAGNRLANALDKR